MKGICIAGAVLSVVAFLAPKVWTESGAGKLSTVSIRNPIFLLDG